mmetsp:Transcript_58531/g.137818  ORF Transcript_58531/g.137818 Transcript_58531/m.137818 type:complete len:246 (+) Transcript_58531:3-740(+)
MLGLFSLKNPKRNDTERNLQLAGSDKASRQHGESEDEIQSPQDDGGAAMKARLRKVQLAKVQQSWASNRRFWGSTHDKGGNCDCCAKPQPMQQSLDEVDFDRGLWGAAVRGDADRVSFLLLNRERNPDELDSSGYAPLHYAARGGKVDVCGLLLQRKASVDLRAGEGRATPLHRACTAGAHDAVALLLGWKASPTAEDADGETPLDKASKSGHSAVIEILRAVPEVRAWESEQQQQQQQPRASQQ